MSKRNFLTPFVVALSALSIASCGGGGGGGGNNGGPNSGAVFSLTTTSVSITEDVLNPRPDNLQITGSVTGATDSVFVEVVIPGNGMFVDGFLGFSGTSGTLTLVPEEPDVLGVGTYSGDIVVRVCNDTACTSQVSGSPKTIRATYDVTATTLDLSLSPVALDGEHRQTTAVTAQLNASAGGAQIWTSSVVYTDGSDWLTLNPPTGAPLPVDIEISAVGPGPGTYRATIEFTGTRGDATGSVDVTYTVTPSELNIAESELAFTLDETTIDSELTQSIAITSGTGTVYPWAVTADADWLTLSADSGTTDGAPLDVTLAPTVADLANGDHVAVLTFTSTDPDVSTVQLPVRLSKQARSARRVSPYVAIAGGGQRVVVFGDRLDTINPGGLSLGGAPVAVYDLINASQLEFDAPALAEGRYAIEIDRPSSLALDTAELVVITPKTYSTAAIALADADRFRPIFDAERSAVYVENSTLGSLQTILERYRYDGTDWSIDSLDLGLTRFEDIRDWEISSDGAYLVAWINDVFVNELLYVDLDAFQVARRVEFDESRVPIGYDLFFHVLGDDSVLIGPNVRFNPATGDYIDIDNSQVAAGSDFDLSSTRTTLSADRTTVFWSVAASSTVPTKLYRYDIADDVLADTGILPPFASPAATDLDGDVFELSGDIYRDLVPVGSLRIDPVRSYLTPAGDAIHYLDVLTDPNQIYWAAEDLASPDGNGGFDFLFPPVPLADDHFGGLVTPAFNAVIYVSDTIFRVTPLP